MQTGVKVCPQKLKFLYMFHAEILDVEQFYAQISK